MAEAKYTPGPWTWRNASGAGLQISATLPAGFKLAGTAHEADGKTSFLTWTLRQAQTLEIADERWLQFSTGSWEEMQEANARLIAAAPDLLTALIAITDQLERIGDTRPGKDGPFIDEARAAIAKATDAA